MDLPASYYGELDKRNPVIAAFEREMSSFIALMRRVSAPNTQDNNSSRAKGIQILLEIWSKYKHRLPPKLYQERMLQVADFLSGIKVHVVPYPPRWLHSEPIRFVALLKPIQQLHQLALWQGYRLHLQQFSSVDITEVADVDHFMSCFFPEGFDTDHDTLTMKLRALQGCCLCVFEQEKSRGVLSQEGLCRLLRVLSFIRITMQAFQQHEHLCWQLYNGSLQIYNICRYLMTMNCSAQALEFLLWASISLELSHHLMTVQHLPWIVTLYCAVCYCYYDNQAAVQAEAFARRAQGKINELAKLEEQSGVPASRETQRAFREASIKLAVMVFKRAVYETRRKPKGVFRTKTKGSLKDVPNAPWPRTATERLLKDTFDGRAAQFLGILEALWDSSRRPLQTGVPDDPELQEVVLELLSAGTSVLAESMSERGGSDRWSLCLSALTPTSTLMDLTIEGDNKISFASAVKFIKLLLRYEQPDVFAALSRQMLQVLADVEGRPFRKAERELALLHSFNSLQCSQRSRLGEDNTTHERHKSGALMSDEVIGLVDTLHKSVCVSALEVQPDRDLVLDVVLFLWCKVKAESKHHTEKLDHHHKLLWCLSVLCEVAFSCDLVTADCITMAEMTHRLAVLLESSADRRKQTHAPVANEAEGVGVKPHSLLCFLQSSRADLLRRTCEVVERGLEALSRALDVLLPQDGSAIADSAFLQKFKSTSASSSRESADGIEDGERKKEVDIKVESDIKSSQSKRTSLLAIDLRLELVIIHHRAALKLLQLNAGVTESQLLDGIRKNKVSKAVLLIQKASLVYNHREPKHSSTTKKLLEDASVLIEKAGLEERKLYICTTSTNKTPNGNKDTGMKEDKENPPPPPILLSRTDRSLTFAPAPYHTEGQVCWYRIFGRAAEGMNQKVRLGDCGLPGTGSLVPAVSGRCVLRVEGLEPNQKYVFAVAAYSSQGKLLGNAIGDTTIPLLASAPLPLLSTWAHLAQVAFQTEQYAVAKRACKELWSHYTSSKSSSHGVQDGFARTKLRVQTLQRSSPLLRQMFLTSIFIETEINVQQGSLHCDSFSDSGPFIWEQEARLAECERVLVAMEMAMWLNDSGAAVQAVVGCYGLLAPLIFHQIACDSVVQVLTKCLIVLEENSAFLRQKWNINTAEALMHMIACITYYLSKALRVLRQHQMASQLMDCGRQLLQEVCDAQLKVNRLANEAEGSKSAVSKVEMKISLQLRAMHGKIRRGITSCEAASTSDMEISQPRELSGREDPVMLYDLITSSPLQSAYQELMKLKCKAFFTEFAALLLQRTIEEDHPDLVIKWGKSIFEFLSRRDKDLEQTAKTLEGKRSDDLVLKGKELLKSYNASSHDETRKKAKQKKQHNVLQSVKTDREMQAVENLLSLMSSLVCRQQQQLKLRKLTCDERVWRSQLNLSLAQAHLALLYKGLEQLHGAALQHRYSQLSPLTFSLAYSGVLVQWRNSHRRLSSGSEVLLAAHKGTEEDEVIGVNDDATAKSDEGREDSPQSVTPQCETHTHTAASLLDSLNSAALHFRRAMVLAHRGSHWSSLQCVCHTVWDQSCRLSDLMERSAQLQPPSSFTAEQLDHSLTPLLALAADLLMDMLKRTGLFSVYDGDATEEELESSLHFSASLDDSTKVDRRWIRTLVLHTLERLHHRGKWETLAHLAERYASIVSPLLVHAQRRLLDRITSCGGPAVPQPHHVKTQKVTGKQVTCRSYADCQLLSGGPPHPKASAKRNNSPAHQTKPTILNKPPPTNSTSTDSIQLQEIQRATSLVCVPLDVEDTLRCYRQALEKRPYCLQVFQHSRSLLLQLLAHTQPSFAAQRRVGSRPGRSAGSVDFSPIIMSSPNLQPEDLTGEDFSTPDALCRPPISPDHLPTVTAAYATSIKYLLANSQDSLRVQALHDAGNLQFYNGNTQSAHSHWCKAVDCALQSSGVLEKWDGETFGGGSMKQTLKLAGIWGCLQAAGLAAKIAQYILTTDMSQRTKCCLLSAHLFKCVLCCCLAQPQSDLQYASHSVGDELLPGVDLFSEPHRLHLGTTVTGLSFLCHWLFATGYHITLLPMLALYQHLVGTVCRDVRRTVEGKILKIRVLTELSLFAQAVKEAVQLTQGADVLLPHRDISTDNLQPVTTFHSNKSLLDNAQALEELVNCDFAPEVHALYGSTLCHRFYLARVRLVLALSSTIHGFPVPACASVTDHSAKSVHKEEDTVGTEGSSENSEGTKVLLALESQKKKLTPENLKFILLEGASSLLSSISHQVTSQSRSEIENLELTIEANLLKADLYLQQGCAALSCHMAASSLELLQTSPVIVGGSTPADVKPASQLPHVSKGSWDVLTPPPADCPTAVEAFERVGAPLWLRCRLALVRSLTAHIPGTAIVSGKNSNEETVRVLQEGLEECDLWGDPDTQALLLLESAVLEEERGKTKEDRISLLQEAVTLLSGRTFMPPASSLTLAQASMMLSDLRGTQSTTLLKLTQKLLQRQLCALGQTVELEDGRLCFPSSGLSNIYLPHLPMLAKITMHVGHILALNALERPVSAQPSESTPKKFPRTSSQIETDSMSPNRSPKNPNADSPTHPSSLSPFHIPKAALSSDAAQAWRDAHRVLHSALILSRSCAYRNTQLEADLLHCRGIVERSLRYFNKVKSEEVAQTFLQCIQTTTRHCHNLPMLRRCYLEVALLFFHDWQQTSLKPPASPSGDKRSHWKRLLASLSRGLSSSEGCLLLFWIFLRGAATVLKATSACSQLLVSAQAGGEALSKTALNSLPAFATSDLLNPCGGVHRRHQDSASQSPEEEESFRASDRKDVQLTWVHVARYYTQLLNQQQTANTAACPQTVESHAVLSGDSRRALRLSQLHDFLCSHMTNYRESCCAPQPAPAEIIQLPQVVQLSSTVRTCLGQKGEIYQWSKSSKQQLCVQWYRPALSPAPGHQDTVILLYGHNRHPLSAMTGSAMGVMGLQCGLHLIKIDRVKAVHAELRKVCMSASVTLCVSANLVCTSDSSAKRLSKTLRGPRNQHVLKLKEEILSCCSSIMDLLQPGSKSEPLTEVPFEITLENLWDLERCLDPAGGAVVDGSALADWILSVLTSSSTSTDKKT